MKELIRLYAFHFLDPCDQSNYKLFKDPDGLHSAGSRAPAAYVCHSDLSAGWYRIQSPAGEDMPTTCLDQYHCGTRFPIWLTGEIIM